MTFEDLQIAEPICMALRSKNYFEPTEIQKVAIPPILNGQDILGSAQTGTGKTAAFALPIIQLLDERSAQNPGNKKGPRSLILTPTRELAIQIEENIQIYGKHTPIKQTVIFGGVKQSSQVAALRKGVDILVATPGRLMDLVGQKLLTLQYVEILVLDEADRMLDMGFINDIRKIIKLLPEKRQNLFFSATMPDNIVALSRDILHNPVKIEVSPVSSTAERITQQLYYTNRDSKKSLLLHILQQEEVDQALLFTRTKRGADKIARILKKGKIKAEAIHGDKAQNSRQKVLNQFKEGKISVLVATDIASRGLDIDKLPFVINYDIPNLPETYVHRIGRSGRAGEEGIAISICEPEENEYIRDIEKLIDLKLTVMKDHPFPQTEKPMTPDEKKEWNKEKARRKHAFFSKRRASAWAN